MKVAGGFFTMDLIARVAEQKDIFEASRMASAAVKATDQATAENARKATAMIANATTVKKLALGMSNFLLSHDYGLKVRR